MKHILLFAALSFVALISSCKKEDKAADPTPQEMLIGRWKASKAFIGTTDVLIPVGADKTELEVEFTENKIMTFHWKNTINSTNPPSVSESELNGTYSWNGDILTITAVSGSDVRSVTGPVAITATHFLFTPNSGDTANFVSKLEADKL